MEIYRNNPTLPDAGDAEVFFNDPTKIPVEYRQFELVFPRIISPGFSDGIDCSIASYKWNGGFWWDQYPRLAGPQGWQCQGPHIFDDTARLVKIRT